MWLERFRIPDLAYRRAEELSKGNQQKVQFIAAILHGPTSCSWTSPLPGWTRSTSRCCATPSWSCATKGIVFLDPPDGAAEALCEIFAIVDHGRLVAGGTLADLKRRSRARTVRLGVEGEIRRPG